MLANFFMALTVQVKTAARKLPLAGSALCHPCVDGRKQYNNSCNNHGISCLALVSDNNIGCEFQVGQFATCYFHLAVSGARLVFNLLFFHSLCYFKVQKVEHFAVQKVQFPSFLNFLNPLNSLNNLQNFQSFHSILFLAFKGQHADF